MTPKTLSKLISALIVVLSFAAWVHHQSVENFAIGREAYLAKQAHHFDRVIVAGAQSPIPAILGAIFVIGIGLGLYELLATVIFKFLTPSVSTQDNQQLGQPY
jgi:xanthine/uracil permease